jgi:hypothetical protein
MYFFSKAFLANTRWLVFLSLFYKAHSKSVLISFDTTVLDSDTVKITTTVSCHFVTIESLHMAQK